MAKTVGITDIAEALRLSRSTVSRALNASSLVSKKTRRLVVETAEQLHFRPNKAARSLVKQTTYTIGVMLFSRPAYFWNEIRYGMQRAEEDLRDFGITLRLYSTDINCPEEQATLIQNLENDSLDGLIISPIDPSRIVEYIDNLVDKAVPVLTVSNDVPESRRFCNIGCDYYRAGRTAGNLMSKFLQRSGEVAILTFVNTVSPIRQRIAGFREVIGRSSDTTILGPYRLSRIGAESYEFTRNLLHEHADLRGIFVSYGILEQVGQAVKDAQRHDDISIIGYDLSSETADLIRADAIDAVITQEPFYQGYYSTRIMADYLLDNKKPPLEVINTKLEIVTRENLLSYEHEAEYCSFLFDI